MTREPAVKVSALSLFACALLAALLLQPPVALANDSSIGATGGSVYPIWTTDVRLAAETVQAVCFGSFVEYRVDFRFVNEGTGQGVKLGFPFTDTVSGERGTERPIGFQAWQNGEPLTVRAVPARYKDGKTTAGYFVHEAWFPRGATTITLSFLAHESGTAVARRSGLTPDDPGFGYANWYEYWLHTGSTWKGSIGKAVVRYRLADSFCGRDIELSAADASESVPVTAPQGWSKPLPQTYQWQFLDFEPKSAGESDWWKPGSPFDVTLGFDGWRTRRSTQVRWTWSSVAAERFGSEDGDRLQDGSLATCWAEGAVGPGIGEWVEARFKRPTRLRELRIVPGNNEYVSAFTRYARPKTLTAVFSDGSSVLLHLKDAPTLQRFPVDVTTRTIRLVVESVYLGTDYPAACISEVEFGTERAPGYAPFARLISDPGATGRLTAWAGPAAPALDDAPRATDWQERDDAEFNACGDLIGISEYAAFAADEAPFREPASLADIAQRHSTVPLPDVELVGAATSVNALSYWTYEIRYASGVDLLVNTRLSGVYSRSVLAELVDEAEYVESYEDERRLPFDLLTIGDTVVGVARPGTIVSDCSEGSECTRSLPGQVFWRDGDRSFHLYARSNTVSTEQLVAIARSLIEPAADVAQEPAATQASSSWQWWVAGCVAAGAAAGVITLLVLRRKRAGAALPPEAPQ